MLKVVSSCALSCCCVFGISFYCKIECTIVNWNPHQLRERLRMKARRPKNERQSGKQPSRRCLETRPSPRKMACASMCMYVHLCVLYVCMDGWMDGWMHGRMDAWMHGCMDGWVDGWMDGWIYIYIYKYDMIWYIDICIYVYIYLYLYMIFVCMYVRVYMCMCMPMYVYVYVCVGMYV